MIGEPSTLLVVAAHADDEVLGAAGAIARAVRSGWTVHSVVLSSSVMSRRLSDDRGDEIRTQRRADALAAAEVLGTTIEVHDLPDNHFDTLPASTINGIVEAAVAEHRPSVVLTHWSHDLSTDHRLTALATKVACRPMPGAPATTVLAYEVRSSTDWMPAATALSFEPSVFVEIDEDGWEAKTRALACYGTELRDAPHSRSVEGVDALSRYRGTQVGVDRAEAFVLLRSVVAR